MNTTINSTTIEPENKSDNTIGLIITLVVVSPILLGGLCFISYMIYFYQLKPWYKKIKNRIKTYFIWFLRKVRYTINSCYESSIVRNNNRNNNENIEITRREKELDILENGGKIKKLTKDEIKVLEINDMCPICYDEIRNKNKISKLKCGHIFHQECISEWTKQCKEGNNCPVCRTDIENDMFIV